ncbi:MAG: M14 family zinc carboxypeptidase, partial [Bacteroidota bacterium]
MIRKTVISVVVGMLLMPCGNLFAQSVYSNTHYHTVKQIQQVLKETHQKHQATTRLITVATSPGGEPVSVLEIGSNLKDVPAIFVGANFEGNIPVATEGALKLIEMLIDSAHYSSALKWFILPQPNPDAAKNFFSNIQYSRTVNDFEVNNDADEAVNEDGYEDLNGDGYITQMRVKNLNGNHVVSKADPRMMVEANMANGERGEYLIYSEGIDNDKDGAYNEDPQGGI